ncbi:hypothetical protein KIN20_001544 [Parelaphostrongylus tenuis]|uniref:Uncharacterized protein n=1 Tax=Parelaphostrongylus tenuis TaxID=148309 RepID=A0AAD5QG93_PARTN|nr:hypothetical protein KIN20_001544 [Parelaphostrongylus tenuis]
MLFSSGLRKAVDQTDPKMAAVMAAADETNQLKERRRRQMLRRHTCSTMKPVLENLAPVKLLPQSSITEEDEDRTKKNPLPPPVAPLSRPPVDDWGAGFPLPATTPTPSSHAAATTNAQAAPSSAGGDDFDDEWTDDEDDVSTWRTKF